MWECSHCKRPIQDFEEGILIADDDLLNWRVVHHISCDDDKGPWHPLAQFIGKRGARNFRSMERGGAFSDLSPDAVRTLRALVVREDYDAKRVRRTKFLDWLRVQVKRDDPIGDLARDVVQDKQGVLQWFRAETWPNPSLSQLYSMLRFRFASSEALVALVEAYREWQSYGNTYRDTRDPVAKPKPQRPPYQTKPIRERDGWLALRFRIFKRDGYRCQLCGRDAQDGIKLEVDHKLARSKGGSDDPANLWTLCFDCNRGKSDDDL